MSQFIENVQGRIKTSSSSFAVFMLRLFSGALFGLTFSLVGQEIFSFGTMMFAFVLLTITLIFVRMSRPWSASGVLLFDLIFVLIAILLRMYIVIAPG